MWKTISLLERGGIQLLLQKYLEPKEISTLWLLNRVKLKPYELANWEVMQYPDALIYELAKVLEINPSQLFYELLKFESIAQIRRTASDYSLLKAIESDAMYIYIPIEFENEESKFLNEILIKKDIYDPEIHPLARFNIMGTTIYKAFLSRLPKSSSYKRIELNLEQYFVLVHDKSGTVLCHESYNKPRRL